MYEAIVWNGKNSYLDFGLTISEPPQMTNPKLNEIRDSVPYMDGDYDFTYQNGRPSYSRRQVRVIFNIVGDSFDDMWKKRCEAVTWLMSAHGSELSFDGFMHGWYFEDVSPYVSEELEIIGKRAGRLEVVFTASPYLSNGRQNISIIPSCPASMGNTFGYIYVSGGEIRTATTDNTVGGIHFNNAGQGVYECEMTGSFPTEFAISLYLSTVNSGEMETEDADKNITSIPVTAAADLTDGRIEVYHYRAAEHPDAVKIQYKVADATTVRTIKAMSFDDTVPALNIPALNAPIKCRRNDADILFSVNGRSVSEAKLSEGGNIVIPSGTTSAEIYAALRKETL